MRSESKHFSPETRDYTLYPREFVTYRWYRPLLTGLLLVVFYFIFALLMILCASFVTHDFDSILSAAAGSYDDMDVYTPMGAIMNLGSVAVMIPALALANRIAGGRPFSSYTSTRGGWDFGIFARCLLITVVVCVIPIAVVQVFFSSNHGSVRFTAAGVILLTIIGPLQCIGEEYVFRGYLMQTVGSWFKLPVLAMILPSAIFAAAHPYNRIGVLSIFISGMSYCLAAWMANGIESSSALHIANNMTAFYTLGLGYGSLTSETNWESLIFSAVMDVLYLAVIYACKKRGMFDRVKRDDAAIWNAKKAAKAALAENEEETVVEFE